MKKTMVQNKTEFNFKKDVQEVDQFGFIDLVKAFQNGYVPGDVESVAENFNDIDEPASIIGKPRDAFEAMRMQDIVVNSKLVRGSAPAKASSSEIEDKN